MPNKVKAFLKSEKGINTVEVVIILAIVVGLAIIFREELGKFANNLMSAIFNTDNDFTPGGMRNITGGGITGGGP
jgi:Flp pilus assembly pilin Flp